MEALRLWISASRKYPTSLLTRVRLSQSWNHGLMEGERWLGSGETMPLMLASCRQFQLLKNWCSLLDRWDCQILHTPKRLKPAPICSTPLTLDSGNIKGRILITLIYNPKFRFHEWYDKLLIYFNDSNQGMVPILVMNFVENHSCHTPRCFLSVKPEVQNPNGHIILQSVCSPIVKTKSNTSLHLSVYLV